MEADSIEECLQGNSVGGLLVPEKPNESVTLAQEAVEQNQPAIAQDAPTATVQPVPKAMVIA